METGKRQLHLVAIGAHIHDAEVMAGAVLAKYIEAGHRATMVHATPGEKGNKAMPFDQYEKVKLDEARRSAAVLGSDVLFMPYKDAELPFTPASVRLTADILRELRPDVILTHWRGSFHPDHYKTHLLATQGATLCADSSYSTSLPAHDCPVLMYAENWEDMTGFRPEVLVDVTSSYDRWHRSMMEHGLFAGGVSAFEYRQYYEGLTASRGALARVGRAVALMRPEFSTRSTVTLPPV